ncbi:DUF917 domain-containing protein [Agromyces aerolatus]|uniref:DUF917 domain-containing protein n=1 Tax=Agromyces sp. LY-1074 TaxID=3074080 RepID=UPI002862F5FF|nr:MULTISPECIES: DUF917 domain-containing protein [unclassified Agromyces]MDR5699332.1 DUF917 domain-containing protein [Agromyces sp. LY-1074]MDR5705628.1 DUF917 domain-containing protein [Agromyces sp. LY-1358]
MRFIGKDDLDDLTLGATLLGNGGGGDPYQARLMALQAIEDFGPIPVVELDELSDDALVVTVAVLGAPTVIIEKIPSGKQYVDAVNALGSYLGKPIAAILPVEVGGMNTLVPLMVAAELGVPCVNADGMRRAFPQIEMTVFTLAGLSASPMALADEHGNQAILDTTTNRMGERLVRTAAMNMGLANAFASYPMTKSQAQTGSIHGSMTYCAEVGRRLRAIQVGTGTWDEFFTFTEGRTIFEGKIVDLDRRTTTGFARGTVVIEAFADQSRTMRIEIQNELLLAIEDGRTVLTPPDLICMLDHETAEPITTEQLSYGQRVRVLGLPCAPEWHRPGMLDVVGPAAFGYDVDYVPFEGVRA